MKKENYYLLNITNDYYRFFKSICTRIGKANYLTKKEPYIYKDIYTDTLIYPEPLNKEINHLTYSKSEKCNKEELEKALNYLTKEDIEKYYINHIKDLNEKNIKVKQKNKILIKK